MAHIKPLSFRCIRRFGRKRLVPRGDGLYHCPGLYERRQRHGVRPRQQPDPRSGGHRSLPDGGRTGDYGRKPFTDVAANKYYTEAVIWAAENQIVKGMVQPTTPPTPPLPGSSWSPYWPLTLRSRVQMSRRRQIRISRMWDRSAITPCQPWRGR